MSAPEIEALASPATSTPWVPLWPLGGQTLGELAYAENSGNTTLTGTNEASPHTVITLPAITVDGATPIVLEFSAPDVTTPAVAQSIVVITLWDGAVDLGRIGYLLNTTGSQPIAAPVFCRRRLTPTAGSHTYSIRAFVSGGSGTVFGGPGGASTFLPVTFRALLAAPISNAPAGALLPVQYGTSLPGSPVDGQEAILVDSLTNPSYQWRFRYNAGSSSPYKWEFVGGAPYMRYEQTDTTLSIQPTVDPLGPVMPVPRAGEYQCRHSGEVHCPSASGALAVHQWQTANGVVAPGGFPSDNYGVVVGAGAGVGQTHLDWPITITAAMLPTDLRVGYTAIGGSDRHSRFRTSSIVPVRVA